MTKKLRTVCLMSSQTNSGELRQSRFVRLVRFFCSSLQSAQFALYFQCSESLPCSWPPSWLTVLEHTASPRLAQSAPSRCHIGMLDFLLRVMYRQPISEDSAAKNRPEKIATICKTCRNTDSLSSSGSFSYDFKIISSKSIGNALGGLRFILHQKEMPLEASGPLSYGFLLISY